MTCFVQRVNPVTGKTCWKFEENDEVEVEHHQAIARSMYADMLHDTDRNERYYDALKYVIKKRKNRNEETRVLDIGTGTGLLSMMAHTCGADSIVACEAFPPIAAVAKSVLKDNGIDKVKVVSKSSLDVTVGEGCDMTSRANVLVAEVFDTELIGEGAITTFNDAKSRLLDEGASVIPERGKVYAAVAESDYLLHCNTLRSQFPLPNGEVLSLPDYVFRCPGTNGVHDLQLSQLDFNDFKLISEPVEVFNFEFGGSELIPLRESSLRDMRAVAGGEAQVVLMWWDLEMDQSTSNNITCAPTWKDPKSPWRDHWMQAVYYLPKRLNLLKGQTFSLLSDHDECSLWFSVYETNLEGEEIRSSGKNTMPRCDCGLHHVLSRTRISEMNNLSRWSQLTSLQIPNGKSFQYFGGISLLPLAVAKMGASKVCCIIDESLMEFKAFKKIVEYNNLQDKVFIFQNKEDLGHQEIDYVISEPYFMRSIYPWDPVRCYFLADDFNLTNGKSFLFPKTMKIHVVAMEFENLYKTKVAIDEVEGFNLRTFDRLIENSSDIADNELETQPLWEYPGFALSEPCLIANLNQENCIQGKTIENSFLISKEGSLHGVAIWVDYLGDSSTISSTAPLDPIQPHQIVKWNRSARQGVYLYKRPQKVSKGQLVNTFFSFNPLEDEGYLNIKFSLAPPRPELSPS